MYEHPHYQYTRFEERELARRAELCRFIAEHSDQIVARQPGPIGRMLRRVGAAFGRRRAVQRQAPCEPAVAR
ncbi:hypothetical protein RS84_01208 [Microbacterium hydrocarbonoxydans]|uniref:Uncharacterized protein n=1 Tax=Microbacterium hydrocarbonoxydans TaxID=273678 RepID=A0A0M2HVG4_9MICO|nr:hypothetical protein [Microbacterium hydrocarbonoxydans]KJL48448.1 hypothetical protein RS84_01208 [Microbacterium hydrocarbonoxydans]